MSQTMKRPWQGTFLFVYDIVAAVVSGAGLLLLATGGAFLSSQFGTLFGAIAGFFAIFLVFGLVLSIFMARGVYKGQKWPLYLHMIFGVLSILGMLQDFSVFAFIITALSIYCAVICYKDPFYNKKA